jgi:hypothetical protein
MPINAPVTTVSDMPESAEQAAQVLDGLALEQSISKICLVTFSDSVTFLAVSAADNDERQLSAAPICVMIWK